MSLKDSFLRQVTRNSTVLIPLVIFVSHQLTSLTTALAVGTA